MVSGWWKDQEAGNRYNCFLTLLPSPSTLLQMGWIFIPLHSTLGELFYGTLCLKSNWWIKNWSQLKSARCPASRGRLQMRDTRTCCSRNPCPRWCPMSFHSLQTLGEWRLMSEDPPKSINGALIIWSGFFPQIFPFVLFLNPMFIYLFFSFLNL